MSESKQVAESSHLVRNRSNCIHPTGPRAVYPAESKQSQKIKISFFSIFFFCSFILCFRHTCDMTFDKSLHSSFFGNICRLMFEHGPSLAGALHGLPLCIVGLCVRSCKSYLRRCRWRRCRSERYFFQNRFTQVKTNQNSLFTKLTISIRFDCCSCDKFGESNKRDS